MSVCSLTGQCFFSRCSETEPDRSCTERKIALSRSLIWMHILKDFTSFFKISSMCCIPNKCKLCQKNGIWLCIRVCYVFWTKQQQFVWQPDGWKTTPTAQKHMGVMWHSNCPRQRQERHHVWKGWHTTHSSKLRKFMMSWGLSLFQ